MNIWRTVLGVSGWIVILFSVFFVVFAIGDLLGGDSKTERGVLWGLLIFFLGTGCGGFFMVRKGFGARQSEAKKEQARKEHALLTCARSLGGKVTVVEVAAACQLGLDETQAMLDHLAAKGIAQQRLNDDGILVYYFPGFLSHQERAES